MGGITLILSALVILAVVLLSVRYYRAKNHDGIVRDVNGVAIPGPGKTFFDPLVGHLKLLAEARTNHTVSSVLKRLISEYGNGDILGLQVFNRQAIMIANPEYIRPVLSGHHMKFPKHEKYNRLKDFLGEGLITASGELWRSQRHIINPVFHASSLRNMIMTFNRHTVMLMNKWRDDVAGQKCVTVDPTDVMTSLTFDIMCEAGFGYESQSKLTGNNEIAEAFRESLDEANRRLVDLFDWSKYLRWGKTQEIERKRDRVRELLNGIIERRIAEKTAAQTTKTSAGATAKSGEKGGSNGGDTHVEGGEEARDLLDVVLDAFWADENLRNNTKLVRDHSITFLVAGHETTSSQIQWILFELTQHPAVQERCRKEVDDVIGTSADVTHEHLSELKYLLQVFKESLRLHPSAPVVTRTLAEPSQIGPYTIPAGYTVGLLIYSVHRHPSYWTNPDSFEPDRWSPDRMPSTIKHPFQYIPFSAGPRNCIGQRFAQFEALVILAHIIKNYEIRLSPSAEGKVRDYETITSRPDGLLVDLIPRRR